MEYLLIIFFAIFTLVAHKNLVNATAILIAMLPCYLVRFSIFGLPSTTLEVMLLIIVSIWFLKFGFNKIYKKYKKQAQYTSFPYQTQIILIIASATISVFSAPNTWKALGLWRAYFIEPILFFLIFIQIIKTKKDLQKILYGLGVSAFSVSVFAIYQKITGNLIPVEMWRPEEVRRVTSFYTSPNAVGLFLSPIIMVYLGWFLSEIKNKHKRAVQALWKISVLSLSVTAVIFTVSEGAWTGLVAAIIFFATIFIYKKQKVERKHIKIFIALVVLSVIIFSTINYSFIKNKADEIIQTPSAQNRLTLWSESWKFLTKNTESFIFGAGIFGFPEIQEGFRDPLKMESLIYPHNIFLNFWMEIGLIGALSFVWIIILFFKKIKYDDVFTLGIASAMVTIIIHGLIDVPYFKNDLSIIFWIIIGLSVLATSKYDKIAKKIKNRK